MQRKRGYSTDNNMFHILLLFLSLGIIFDENSAESLFKPAETSRGYTTGPELISIVTQPLVFTGSIWNEMTKAPIVSQNDAAYLKYGFQYVANVPSSGDSQLQPEQRDVNLAQRQYTVFHSDDSARSVELTADEKDALNAVFLQSEYGPADKDVGEYTIGVARGGNQDWANRRRRPSTTTTKRPEFIGVY